jgi:acetylornithine deacetylase
VLAALERLDRTLQARPPHPLMGTASLHASLIAGGQELSSYPERCVLKMERRTIAGETIEQARAELEAVLRELRDADAEFEADLEVLFARPAYEVGERHALPQALRAALAANGGGGSQRFEGMSFWTDAAILGEAGIPSVLFGPAGAGLHSTEEYVEIDAVLRCRDTLASLARGWCGGAG